MSFTMNRINDHTMRYLFYSVEGNAIAPGFGRLMTITLNPLGGSVPEDTYKVEINNVKMGTKNMDNKYAGYDIEREFKALSQMLLGDADDNGVVDENDKWRIYNYIMNENNIYMVRYGYLDINFALADINQDGKVNIADIVLLINILNQ